MRVSDFPLDEQEWWGAIACQERSCHHCHCTDQDMPCPYHNVNPAERDIP